MTDLIVMRLADMLRVHPDQITMRCAKCGEEVGVYPSGQRVMREWPDIRLVCQVCKEPNNAVEMLAPGALVEALEFEGQRLMTISHEQPPPDGGAFVFAELGGFTCSICAPNDMAVGDVIKFAEERFPSDGERWVSVDKSQLGMGSATPNPCNFAHDHRTHWFMMRGTMFS